MQLVSELRESQRREKELKVEVEVIKSSLNLEKQNNEEIIIDRDRLRILYDEKESSLQVQFQSEVKIILLLICSTIILKNLFSQAALLDKSALEAKIFKISDRANSKENVSNSQVIVGTVDCLPSLSLVKVNI